LLPEDPEAVPKGTAPVSAWLNTLPEKQGLGNLTLMVAQKISPLFPFTKTAISITVLPCPTTAQRNIKLLNKE